MSSVDTMIGMLQEQLKRHGFDDFTNIEYKCMHFDINRSTSAASGQKSAPAIRSGDLDFLSDRCTSITD